MHLNKHLIYSLLLMFLGNVYGQGNIAKTAVKQNNEPSQLQEYFEDAEFFYEQEDYREALYNFQKVYEKLSNNANLNFRIGMCYMNISGEETKAIPYFENALPKISPKYGQSNIDQTTAPIHTLYYLGNAYRIDNQLDKAFSLYKTFRNHPYFEGHYNEDMVENELTACERAKLIQDNPVQISFENVGSAINNAYPNSNPVVNSDETVMVYLSGLKFYNAIMVSKKVNGVWGEPENISAQIGTDGDCEPLYLSADSKELYMVKKLKGNNDLYISTFDGKFWLPMKPLNKLINSNKNESHASLSPDGLTLYFTSDRRGGEGGLDIYKAERKPNGDWGNITNLGNTINTAKNEASPFMSSDNHTLWFSSESHLNMGGYDIFTARWLPEGKWDIPVNVGFPLNTTGDNLNFYPVRNGESGFISINKPGGQGKEDIYRVENNTLKARNIKLATQNMKPVKVIVRNKETKEIVGILLYDKPAETFTFDKQSEKMDIRIENR